MNFHDLFKKPLLAEDFDENNVALPAYLSPKLDGIRGTAVQDTVMSRSMKPIPNAHARDIVRAYQGLDGEFIFGEPTHEDCYNLTYSAVMKQKVDHADGVRFFVFDCVKDMRAPFIERLQMAAEIVKASGDPRLVLVPHIEVPDLKTMLMLEEEWLNMGYEGAMLRRPDAQYKQGRSTLKEAILLKVKRFKDSECVVLKLEEMMQNTNEAFTNELGRTARSSHKEGMVGKGTFGRALVRDIYSGVEFYIGGGKGMTAVKRAEIWANRESIPGDLWKYTFFPIGVVDKPRFPQWAGERSRDDIDLSKAKFL